VTEVLIEKFPLDNGGFWGEITLNRPEKRNAINGPLGVGLSEAFNEVSADQSVQAVLLKGSEGAFCSGLDLEDFNASPPPSWLPNFQKIWRHAHRAIYNCPIPIIVALERYAINGGAALALAADYLVAGDQSFLQVGEVKIGMAAPYNMAWMSLRHPESVIAEVALIGEKLGSNDMTRLNLVNRIVSDNEVVQSARALCETIGGYPEGATRKLKNSLRASRDKDADQWFDLFAPGAGQEVRPSSMK
tara:strand:+ start:567 stop:1304 length:738 start_codon:yes stop_codon:yes gene_type:complete